MDCFISICNFGSFKYPFATITSLSKLYFGFRRFILLGQIKKDVSMNYGSSRSSWKSWRWVRLGLMKNIYINSNLNRLTKLTSSRRSIEFKDILPWNISQMIKKTISIRMRTVISNAMKRGFPLWIWSKLNENWDSNMIIISQWKENHCRTITNARRKKEIQKSRTVRIAVWDPIMQVSHLCKVVWDRKITTEFTRYQFHLNR